MKAGILFYSDALRAKYGHAIYARFDTATPHGNCADRAFGGRGGISIHVLSGRELTNGSRFLPEAKLLPIEDQRAVLQYFMALIKESCPESWPMPGKDVFRYPRQKVVDNLDTERIVAGYYLAKQVEKDVLYFTNEVLDTSRFHVI